MAVDRDGFLWIGTFGGLVRFDGNRFLTFDQRTMPALPDEGVNRLYADRAGRIWIGTGLGLAVLERGVIRSLPPGPNFPIRRVESMVEDREGRLVVSGAGRQLVRREGDRFVPLPVPGLPTPEGLDEVGLVADDEGAIYAERGSTLFRLEGDEWRAVHQLDGEVILGLGLRRAGGIWICGERSIYRYDDGEAKVVYARVPTAAHDYSNVYEDSAGDLWTASYVHGATRYRAGAPPLVLAKQNGLPESSIRFVFEGPEASLWIGTDGGGLVRLRRAVARTYREADGLTHDIVRTILTDGPGRAWIGTHGGGLVRFDRGAFVPVPVLGQDEPPGWVWALTVDHQHRLWAGFLNRGLYRLDHGGPVRVELPGFERPSIRALDEDPSGSIWVGTEDGLFVVRGAKAELLEPGLSVRSLAHYGGRLLIGTETKGLLTLAEEGGLTPVAPALDHQEIVGMSEGPGGVLWFALGESLVARFDGSHVLEIGPAQGLPVARYRQVAFDRRGDVWFASSRGAVRLFADQVEELAAGQRRELEATTVGPSLGLGSADVNTIATIEDPISGEPRIGLGTLGGLSILDPTKVEAGDEPRAVIFESLCWVDPSRTSPANPETCVSIDESTPQPVRLPPGSFGVRARFTTPSFSEPEALRFELELDSSGNKFTRRLTDRELTFQLVGPGLHRLRLKARSPQGVWGPAPTELAFWVEPHTWQEPWFAPGVSGLVAVIGTGVGSALLLGRLRRTREALAQERKLRKLEAGLVEHQRRESLGVLAGGIAHDFNNILTGVLANAHLLKDTLEVASNEPKEILDDIESAARRAADLCRQLLAYAGGGKIAFEPLESGAMVKEALRLLKGSIPGRVEIEVGYPEAPLWLHGDAAQLQQVLLNLLINGIESIEGEGRLKVEVGARRFGDLPERPIVEVSGAADEYVEIRIIDTGRGIAPEIERRIFEPFFSTKGTGRGLGLAAVAGIVRSHRGALYLESTPERGTTFVLYFPKVEAPAPSVPAVVSPPVASAEASVVLVIDDEAAIRKIVAYGVKKLGYRSIEAENGKLGLDRWQAEPEAIRLVIVDLSMPVMGGEATIRAIRERRPEQRILVMSGFDSTDAMEHLKGEKGIVFLAKPFDLTQLRNAIQDALA